MKWRVITILFSVTLSASLIIHSCRKGQEDIPGKTPLSFIVPAGFPSPVYDFSINPLTEEGFQLGRKLFYDGILSIDGKYPCASCHQQMAVFGTYDHDLSHGYNDQHSNRNAPALFNLAWKKEFHTDGKFRSLEEECLDPIQAPNQMADEAGNVITKLRSDEHYRDLFKKAFGSSEITIQRMQKALAQFMLQMITVNSKYDQVKRGENSFTDYSYRNIGLIVSEDLKDYGRMVVTGKKEDSLKFHVPSLRNVSLTFPYMHDGRYSSLQACIEHYGKNIQQGPTLDPLLKNGIHFTNSEEIDLVAFLRTLTDSTLIKDTRFSHPH